MEKLLLTIREVEALTSICRSALYEFMATGLLRSIKVGKSRRVARVDLDTFVEELRQGTLPTERDARKGARLT